VQLRFQSGHTSESYVTEQGWRSASLLCCPLHPRGGCGFARHTCYERKTPPGTLIARWYCRKGRCTFSLLPDHLAARFPGTLSDIEQVVAAAEQAKSVEATANELRRDDISLTSAVRWVRRRVVLVRRLLITVVGLLPDPLQGCVPTLAEVGARLGSDEVLIRLRALAAAHLPFLARPLGFRPPPALAGEHKAAFQHDMGPDPPGGAR
jgi:hypothetical protein